MKMLQQQNQNDGETPRADKFSCGQCEMVTNMLVEFLFHKAEHLSKAGKIGCELCQISYQKYDALIKHYKLKHNLRKKTKTHLSDQKTNKVQAKEASQGANLHNVTDIELDTAKDGTRLENSDGQPLLTHDTNSVNCYSNPSAELETGNIFHSEGKEVVICVQSSTVTCDNSLPQSFTGTCSEPCIAVVHAVNYSEKDSSQENIACYENTSFELSQNNAQSSFSSIQNTNDQFQESIQFQGQTESLLSTTNLPQQTTLGPAEVNTSDADTDIYMNSSNEPVTSLHVDLYLNSDPSDRSHDDFSMETTNTKGDGANSLLEGGCKDFQFILGNMVQNGKSISYRKQTYRCLYCNFWSANSKRLCRHMGECHNGQTVPQQNFQVHNPDKRADYSILKMSEHLAALEEQKRSQAKQRDRGPEKQDVVGEFICPVCHKSYARLRYLRRHMGTHEEGKSFLCDECGKAFATKMYLAMHRKTHKKQTYVCKQCGFTSMNKSSIHHHRQLHPDNCILCDICGAAFPNKFSLQKHQRVHDPKRPFRCSYPSCTLRFKTQMMCRAHIRSHTESSPGKFACTICQYHFKHKHHLQRHMTRVHGITLQKNDQDLELSTMEGNKDNSNNVLILDNDDHSSAIELQSVLSNPLVISGDVDGQTISYEVTDIPASYQAFLQQQPGEGVSCEETILLSHADEEEDGENSHVT